MVFGLDVCLIFDLDGALCGRYFGYLFLLWCVVCFVVLLGCVVLGCGAHGV
jgi:hypothetical protein